MAACLTPRRRPAASGGPAGGAPQPRKPLAGRELAPRAQTAAAARAARRRPLWRQTTPIAGGGALPARGRRVQQCAAPGCHARPRARAPATARGRRSSRRCCSPTQHACAAGRRRHQQRAWLVHTSWRRRPWRCDVPSPVRSSPLVGWWVTAVCAGVDQLSSVRGPCPHSDGTSPPKHPAERQAGCADVYTLAPCQYAAAAHVCGAVEPAAVDAHQMHWVPMDLATSARAGAGRGGAAHTPVNTVAVWCGFGYRRGVFWGAGIERTPIDTLEEDAN